MQTEGRATSTDVSETDIGPLEDAWKAHCAVRDEDLADKLCNALETDSRAAFSRFLGHSGIFFHPPWRKIPSYDNGLMSRKLTCVTVFYFLLLPNIQL